jgi:hypothetical protein
VTRVFRFEFSGLRGHLAGNIRKEAGMARHVDQPRRDRIRALQMLLRQLRTCGGAWSDGQRIHRGADLAELRSRTSDRIVAIRSGMTTPQDALAWHNFAALQRLKRRAGEPTPPLAGQLAQSILAGAAARDPGGRDRCRIARRALRRLDPQAFAALPREARHSQMEMRFIEAAEVFRDAETDDVTVLFDPGKF